MINAPVKDKDDDQMFYTRAFLDVATRDKYQIKLDYKSDVFLNLNGASNDIRLVYNDASGEYSIKHSITETTPSLIHGNGPSKDLLNNFGSYLAGAYKHKECQLCNEQKLDVNPHDDMNALPTVTMGLFIVKATPFLEEYFDSIRSIDYPKEKLFLFVYNNVSDIELNVIR